MKILSRLFSGTALIALACTAANATSIIGYNASQAASTSSGFTLTLNKFDPGLGTLTGVTIYFTAQVNETNLSIISTDPTNTNVYNYSVTDNLTKNFANSATAANTIGNKTVEVFDTGIGSSLGNCSDNPSTTVPANPLYGCNGITLAPNASTGNLGPYSISITDANYGLTTGTGTNGLLGLTITGTNLANYTAAASTFTLTGTTQGSAASNELNSGTTNATFINTSTQQFAAEVDYTYISSAPEPGTMLLVGSGLVGLGLIRSRRRKNA